MSAIPDSWSELRAGFPTAVAALFGNAFGVSTLSAMYTLGVLAGPLEQAFGWSRATIFSVPVFVLAGMIPGSLLVAPAVERIGLVRVIVSSQVALSACFVLLGLTLKSLTTLYSVYFAMGLLSTGTLPVTFARSLVSQFVTARGLALGIALCGSGVCALLLPHYLGAANALYGWRGAYFALALLPVGVALPMTLLFLKDGPKEPVVAAGAGRSTELPYGLRAAARDYRFWIFAVAFLMLSAAMTGTLTNLIPVLLGSGYDPLRAASLASSIGVTVIVGRLFVGTLLDRFWAPGVAFVCLAPAAIGVAALALSHRELWTTLAIGALGFATGSELDLSAYLLSRYFPPTGFTRIYAVLYLIMGAGAASASPVFGRAYDLYGDYSGVLAIASAGIALSAVSFLALGRYPKSVGGSLSVERTYERAARRSASD